MEFLSNSYDDLVKKAQKFDTSSSNLGKKVALLQAELLRSSNNIRQIKITLNDQEQYSRRDCLEIRGGLSNTHDASRIVYSKSLSVSGRQQLYNMKLNELMACHHATKQNSVRDGS